MAGKDLASFVLENVEELESGEKKGAGAYGAVYRVTVKGVTCIDKRLHDILVKPEVPRRQRESIQEKFYAECVMLSKLRHPHIVHFVGVRCGPNPSDLSLVMECLHTDLAKFLEEHQEKGVDIPLSIKLSILLDVSYGLLYLHTLDPPIIHRDLSANNILLTTDGLQAKIADLGVSKLLDFQTQAKIVQTKVPGSQNYMPPEALTENPQYGVKLDIFSFGHLMLYTATQVFPGVHEVTLTPANLEQGTIQIMKRAIAIDQMGGERNCLHPLAIQCLQDKPERRPTTLKLNESLKEQCTKHPRRVADVLQLSGEMEKVTAETNAVWRSMVDKLKTQLEEMTMKDECARRQLDSMTEDSRNAHQKCQEVEAESKQISEQMKKLSRYNNDNIALYNKSKAQVRRLEQEKEALQNEVQIAKAEAESEHQCRKEAHLKIAHLATLHAEETERLEAEQLQMQNQLKKVIEERYQHQLQSMATQLNHTSQDLQKHKERLAAMETLLHSQIEQLSDHLSEKDQQVAAITNENDRLQEEVLSKTQQVKHYKKQVDQYKEEEGALKQYVEMQIKQSFPAKTESQALSRVKASPPMQKAHSSNEASGYNSQHARTSPLGKMKVHSVDNDSMMNSQDTGSYSLQPPVPRAMVDNQASTLPAHTKPAHSSNEPSQHARTSPLQKMKVHSTSANIHCPVEETQQDPPGQPQPSQAAYTSPNSSQPGRGKDPDRLDAGIELEIYHVAKDVMKSDSEAPQTLADEGTPYDLT